MSRPATVLLTCTCAFTICPLLKRFDLLQSRVGHLCLRRCSERSKQPAHLTPGVSSDFCLGRCSDCQASSRYSWFAKPGTKKQVISPAGWLMMKSLDATTFVCHDNANCVQHTGRGITTLLGKLQISGLGQPFNRSSHLHLTGHTAAGHSTCSLVRLAKDQGACAPGEPAPV